MKLCYVSITTVVIIATMATLAAALEIKNATFTTENAGKVVFSHSTHMKKKNAKTPNVSCKSCHNDRIKNGTHYTIAQI